MLLIKFSARVLHAVECIFRIIHFSLWKEFSAACNVICRYYYPQRRYFNCEACNVSYIKLCSVKSHFCCSINLDPWKIFGHTTWKERNETGCNQYYFLVVLYVCKLFEYFMRCASKKGKERKEIYIFISKSFTCTFMTISNVIWGTKCMQITCIICYVKNYELVESLDSLGSIGANSNE